MKKTKTLIYVTQLLESGGIESHLKEFCRNMNAEEMDLSILIGYYKGDTKTKLYYQSICKNAWFIQSKYAPIRLLALLLKIWVLRMEKFETLYTNGQGKSIWHVGKLLGKKHHWVHHHHTSGDEIDQASWPNEYRMAMKKCQAVIACARPNALNLAQVLQREVLNIPCFSVSLEPKNYEFPEAGKIKIGYFGRLIKEKGIELMCKLSQDKDLTEIDFYIWGRGANFPPSYFNDYPINYRGHFSSTEALNEIIQWLDGFILLSEHPEGLPISLLEVMSSGLPWLATNKGGIKDLSINPNLNMVIPSDSDYTVIKRHLLNFVASIKNGNTNRLQQIEKYHMEYAVKAIENQWQIVLRP
jgi:glycosyltransferase involved in cell wall biosynthesis